jgi:hypothetical protein
MPSPGFIKRQIIVQDNIPESGSILYESTIISVQPPAGMVGAVPTTSTIVGGAILKTNRLSEYDNIGITGVAASEGTIVATIGRVLGFGKALGSLIGTNYGTVVADSNTVLVQLYVAGTLGATGQANEQPPAGATLIGSILALETGV